MEALYPGNDQTIKVLGLRDANAAAGVYLNAATVTVTLMNRDRTVVTGETWPLTMTYQPATNGEYRANLEDALVLFEGRDYLIEVRAVSGALRAKWTLLRPAVYRTE